MNQKSRFTWMTLTAVIVLFASAIYTVPALADDGIPPAEDAPAIVVPEGTDVVPADNVESPAPLAIPDNAPVVEKDPMWCPSGVAPKASTGGCSASFGDLNALVTGYVPPAKNGMIWIENGADNQAGSYVLINGAGTWAPAKDFSLTLQGGWIGGLTGSKAIVGNSLFDSAINIINWNGAVTVYDITIQGAANAYDSNKGALYIATAKNILLGNVAITGTTGGSTDGAYLENTFSTTQASITVKNSIFNGNAYRGITLLSKGAITLTNITANNNVADNGVYLNNNNDTLASLVTLTNGTFSHNGNGGGDDGLHILSNGAVKLSQITANYNYGSGVSVDNSAATTAQAVTQTGYLSASYNSENGLLIDGSKGVVTLINLTTNYNTLNGTYIDNTYGVLPAAVTINGTNFFNDNDSYGLEVISFGAITTNNLTANYNGYTGDLYGVYMYNNFDASKPQNITLNGSNYFDNNSSWGMELYSYGVIKTNNLTATNNGQGVVDSTGGGVQIENNGAATPKSVTLNGVNFFANNEAKGLSIYTRGSVTTTNLTASQNATGIGVYIDATDGTSANAVNLKGTNVFEGNNAGLSIYTEGAITVNNITAYYNSSGYGAYLYNNYGTFTSPITITGYGLFDQNGYDGLHAESNGAITTNNLSANDNNDNGVYLYTIGLTKPQTVTMKGNNSFRYNGSAGMESGLIVYADGNITINNLVADSNYYFGALLDNYTNWFSNSFLTYGSVNLTGTNIVSNNGNDGLQVDTWGNTTLTKLTSTYNGDDGIQINAHGHKNVTLSCVISTNNAYGVYINGGPIPLLTIKGLVSSNANPDILTATTTVRGRCP